MRSGGWGVARRVVVTLYPAAMDEYTSRMLVSVLLLRKRFSTMSTSGCALLLRMAFFFMGRAPAAAGGGGGTSTCRADRRRARYSASAAMRCRGSRPTTKRPCCIVGAGSVLLLPVEGLCLPGGWQVSGGGRMGCCRCHYRVPRPIRER